MPSSHAVHVRPGAPHPALRELCALVRAEVELIAIYGRLAGSGDIGRSALQAKADGERHALDLARILVALGAAPPQLNRGTARLRRALPWGSLRCAARSATRLAQRYERALAWDLPLEVIATLNANAIDLRAHAARFACAESAAHRWPRRAKLVLHQLGRRLATSTMRA